MPPSPASKSKTGMTMINYLFQNLTYEACPESKDTSRVGR